MKGDRNESTTRKTAGATAQAGRGDRSSKKREAFGRRLLAIAKKAGADLIEDDAYWQTIFARAVEDYQKQVQVQQPVVPRVIETQEPEEEV